ncbi:MAG: DNA-3-methyladenine glycosylase [Myxococcales bacterium]|jgi:DNA-3-methyladenine glycosylase|nr:DNA-3-methyladenine glycosylase [Myxococcales bacterium]
MIDGWAPLPRGFYARPTATVARELLGKLLVRPGGSSVPGATGPRLARIVEVEAYLGLKDAASHARRGPTPRAAIMFGPPGFLYVYLIYGMYHCMNFVTEADGTAGAVLIRAAEPLLGFPEASSAAAAAGGATGGRRRGPLAGPGKVCAALGITLRDKGIDLTKAGDFYVADDGQPAPRRATSSRIGVDYAGPWAAQKLRFYVPGHPSVSGKPR